MSSSTAASKSKSSSSSSSEMKTFVSTTVKDSFFEDPFFSDWWKDFDAPAVQTYNKTFNRQISETPRKSLLDSFFDLKEGKGGSFASTSTTTQQSCMSLKDGKFSIEVDIQDFDPEDIDIRVEGGFLLLVGEREVKRGSSFSKRFFNQRLELPDGIDVDGLSTEIHHGGKLIITAPQKKMKTASAAVGGKEEEEATTKEVSKTGETITTVSEGEIALEGGGIAKTSASETQDKKVKVETIRKETMDGSFEEEIIEEEEIVMESSSSTTTTSINAVAGAGDSTAFLDGGGTSNCNLLGSLDIQIPILKTGAAGGTTNTTVAKSQEHLKSEKGQVVEMSKTQSSASQIKEMVIPIQIGGGGVAANRSSGRTPKPRSLPFSFDFPSFEMIGGGGSVGAIPSANELMAQMQVQMAQMQKATVEQMQQNFVLSTGELQQQPQPQQLATASVVEQQQQQEKLTVAAAELENQEFFVPLKNIGAVKKNALAEATAMAKMKGDYFELVVNIQRFTPEEIKVYLAGQGVVVQAKKETVDGFVTDSYEQKFSLPDDVAVDRLTSGISRDGVLMIRVPRRSPERIIPIQYDAKIEAAVEKALQHTIQDMINEELQVSGGGCSQEIKNELEQKNIVPITIKAQEDAVKAASAEFIEAITVGECQQAGAEAGEEAGDKAAAAQAENNQEVQAMVKEAVVAMASKVGMEIAGEFGVKIAVAAALEAGLEAGKAAAVTIGTEIGREVGRVSGGQAAAMAGAEALAKMNMAEITQEKAQELKAEFIEIGKGIGANAGNKAGTLAGNNIIDSAAASRPIIQEAEEVAKAMAEKAALKAKELLDLASEVATSVGGQIGEEAGKAAGELSGAQIAVEAAVKAATEAAGQAVQLILGEGELAKRCSLDIASATAAEIAKKLGKSVGGEVGGEAGKIAAIEAAIDTARAEVVKENPLEVVGNETGRGEGEASLEKLRFKLKAAVECKAKEVATKAGHEAGLKIEVLAIIAEAVEGAKKAAEAQALDFKAFETMSSEIAEEAGRKAGAKSGTDAGADAGEKVALESLAKELEAIKQEAEKVGKDIFGEIGAKLGKEAGERASRELASRLGRELGAEAGKEAGQQAGAKAGSVAGKREAAAADHATVLLMTEQSSAEEVLKGKLVEVGTKAGTEAGIGAGTDAGSKIDIGRILQDAVEAAKKAAEQAAGLAKASEQAAEAKELESILLAGAKEAGELAGDSSAKEVAVVSAMEAIMADITKICEEEGVKAGTEVYGEFGATVGKEAALLHGKKAAMAKVKEVIVSVASDLGRVAGGEAGMTAGLEELKKHDLKSTTVAVLRQAFLEVGAASGREAGIKVGKLAFQKLDIQAVLSEVRVVARTSAEKYATKAREFCKMSVKIAEDAGAKAGKAGGKEVGADAGQDAGGMGGEEVGRQAGLKAGTEIGGGEIGGRVGAEAGAVAGRKFGMKAGKIAGVQAGEEFGAKAGRHAGGQAGLEVAIKEFQIGITKERVAALKKTFAEVGGKAGDTSGREAGKLEATKAGDEEGRKFGYEEGAKAGAAAARKAIAGEAKVLRNKGHDIGEGVGAGAGEKAGAEAGEKAGGEEAERLGADEGERIGREIAGDEGAAIGREIGAEIAKLAGAKLGKKVGRTAGCIAGRKAGKEAAGKAGEIAAKTMTREAVDALKKLFEDAATKAGAEAGAKAGFEEAMRAVHRIAIETAAKAARDKILAMASKGQIKLSASWKPTALIAVIAGRSDLSDMDKIKLAAKAKMEGNLKELLPQRHHSISSKQWEEKNDPLAGKLKFSAAESQGGAVTAEAEGVDQTKKWQTVVFTDLPDEEKKKKPDRSGGVKDNVNSLRSRFETKNMKDNEAYVIM